MRTATVNILSNDGDESPYDFAIQGIGDADVGDILANARVTSLVNAGSLNLQESVGNGGNFNADVDLYQFSAQAGSRVTVSTAAVAGGLSFDSYLRLFDADAPNWPRMTTPARECIRKSPTFCCREQAFTTWESPGFPTRSMIL